LLRQQLRYGLHVAVVIVVVVVKDGMGLIPGRGRDFSILHSVQTCSGAHIISSPMSTRGSFLESKIAEA
jgi:hypothetical protein